MSISSNLPKGPGHNHNHDDIELNEKDEEQAQEKKEFHQQSSHTDTYNKQESFSHDSSKASTQDNTEVRRNRKLKRALRVMGMGVPPDKQMKLQNTRQAEKLKAEQREVIQKDEINHEILEKQILDKEIKNRILVEQQKKTRIESEENKAKKPADEVVLPPDNDPNNIIRI